MDAGRGERRAITHAGLTLKRSNRRHECTRLGHAANRVANLSLATVCVAVVVSDSLIQVFNIHFPSLSAF